MYIVIISSQFGTATEDSHGSYGQRVDAWSDESVVIVQMAETILVVDNHECSGMISMMNMKYIKNRGRLDDACDGFTNVDIWLQVVDETMIYGRIDGMII